MDVIWEKARDVGRLLAQSDEYQALKRANTRMGEDRETLARLTRLQELEESFARMLERGEEPPQEGQEEYESLATQVQASAAYQGFAAARGNFDRVMMRVHEEIAKGIEAGEQSRIILAT